jgi:hypothetical protein
MSNDDETDWLSGQEAAALLQMSERSVQRYASGATARIRTRKRTGSKRFYYYRPDVENLAAEMVRRPPPLPPEQKVELLPAGATLDYLRARDEELRDAQRQLQAAALELGQARAELQRRQLVDEQLQTVQAERDEVRRQIGRLQLQRAMLAVAVIMLLVALVAIVVIVLNS